MSLSSGLETEFDICGVIDGIPVDILLVLRKGHGLKERWGGYVGRRYVTVGLVRRERIGDSRFEVQFEGRR
jgi:hypothetical protein